MKIESSSPMQIASTSSHEHSKNVPSRQNVSDVSTVKSTEISRPDTNFRTKSLAVSSALAGTTDGPVSNQKASSSSVVSKQAAPFLSSDEIQFFEGVIRQRNPNYSNYSQQAAKLGKSLSLLA